MLHGGGGVEGAREDVVCGEAGAVGVGGVGELEGEPLGVGEEGFAPGERGEVGQVGIGGGW